MKKLLSILLALAMMMSLLGVAALADGEAEEVVEIEEIAETLETGEETVPALTILFTGEVGIPAAEETEETADGEEAVSTMGYASAAALKEHYAQSGSVLLVDAGGFAPSAVAVMEAAGYDLAVTGDAITSDTLVALAPVADSPSGAMVNKGEMIVAFIGINIPAVEETEETEDSADGEEETDPNAALYAVIQESVDKAADADYVILIGLCADAKALAENITGADAILTTGEGVETIEKEDETSVLVVGAKAAFGSIGVVTIDGEGLTAEVLDAEGYAALELTESEDLTAQEAAWIEEANKSEEEQPEETTQPEEPDQTDPVVPTPAVTPAVPVDDTTDNGEETPAGDNGEETPAGDDGEETPAGDDGEETPAGDDGEETPAGDDGEETPAEDDGEETPAEDDGEETPAEEDGKEESDPEPTPEQDTAINWSKGTEDLEIVFENRVSELKVANPLVEGSDYVVGEGGNVVYVSADMLNGWPNGRYEFVAVYPDGSQGSQIVSISGEYEAPVPTEEPVATSVPTDEPAPTAEADTVINWSKGTQELKITFRNRVSELKVGGNTLVEGSDYTVTDEGNTVAISADMMNGWPNAKYAFTAIYPDGSQDSLMVSITGEYEAPKTEAENESEKLEGDGQEEATATPEPTKTPGSTPNTGDSNPIMLYVIILGILVIALVVVLVMTGKKNKRK